MTINEAALAAAKETERQLTLIPYQSTQLAAAIASARAAANDIASIPEPVKNVQFYGAKGDGVTDDTDAFNAAAATGSLIVDVPGTYLLDGVKRVSILQDRTVMRVNQTPGAVRFAEKANAAPKTRIFNVNGSDCDLDLGGAYLIGDRDMHRFTAGSTHEWGYCFFLGGARNKLYGNGLGMFTKATGDGLGVSGPDHEVFGLVLDGNRRQGCSAFNAPRLNFHDNICRNTGNNGLPDPAGLIGPFCGFDCEPDGGDCLDLFIHNNTFGPNNRSGAIAWINSRAAKATPNMKLSGRFEDNTFIGNSNGTWMCKEVAGSTPAITFTFLRNRFVNNKATDIKCDQGSAVTIGDATAANANIFDDFLERPDALKKGLFSPEMQVLRGAKVTAGLSLVI